MLLRLQYCDEWGYLAIGLTAALPCVLLPPLLQPKEEAAKPLLEARPGRGSC